MIFAKFLNWFENRTGLSNRLSVMVGTFNLTGIGDKRDTLPIAVMVCAGAWRRGPSHLRIVATRLLLKGLDFRVDLAQQGE